MKTKQMQKANPIFPLSFINSTSRNSLNSACFFAASAPHASRNILPRTNTPTAVYLNQKYNVK